MVGVMVGSRVRSATFVLVGVVIAVIVSGCSSNGGWETMPEGPLTARGFAATACMDEGMVVWSGAQPSGGPRNETHDGGAMFADGEWHELPVGTLLPRMSAGAAESSGRVLVWGGRDGLVASEDPEDFIYYNDGALFNLENGTWTMAPPSPLSGRSDSKILDLGGAFLIYGGSPRPGGRPPGVLPAARFDLQSETWEVIAGPPNESLVAVGDGLVAFASGGIFRYEPSADEWIVDALYPAGIVAPKVVASSGSRVAGGAGAVVWVYDEDFEALPDAPVEDIAYVGWLGDDIVVWSSLDGAAAIYDEDSGDWDRHDGSVFRQPRVGSSVCVDDSRLYVWGGWVDREVAYVASDSGASLSRP